MAQIEKFRIENTSRGDSTADARNVASQQTSHVHIANATRVARFGILVTATPRCGSPNPAVVVRNVVTVLAVLVTSQDENRVFNCSISLVSVVGNKVNGM